MRFKLERFKFLKKEEKVPEEISKEVPEEISKEVPEDYWFKIAEKLAEESGEIPDSLEIRAKAIIKACGLPSGLYSALEKPKKEETEKEGKERIKKDKIIAEYLTNKPGVLIEGRTREDEEFTIVSNDFRDLYPDGLPSELKEVLEPKTKEIMEIEYKDVEGIKKDTTDYYRADCPIHYFRLPGGIDLFIKGYLHDPKWQENHGKFLKEINKRAKVICIEGYSTRPYGESLDSYWSKPEHLVGDYEVLMKEAAAAGFKGVFTEIDARDMSKIRMDSTISYLFPDLPFDFFKKYFEFLEREEPSLTKILDSPEELKKALIAQSTTIEGIDKEEKTIFHQGKTYYPFPYYSKEGKVSFEPTFLELGQFLFSDALASIKLHLIAKLMADGHLEKGPIIDYEGAGHTPSKSFFLKYPQYAMEVTLRKVNEIKAGRVKNLSEIYKVFENPNWEEITKEIFRLVFKKPEEGKLVDVSIDFLKTYHIDPKKIIPSDEKIKEIREKIARLKEK